MFSSHLVFFFLGLAEDARIVCPAAVGLHGPRHSHAGHQDHRHGQDEADAEEVAGVAEASGELASGIQEQSKSKSVQEKIKQSTKAQMTAINSKIEVVNTSYIIWYLRAL